MRSESLNHCPSSSLAAICTRKAHQQLKLSASHTELIVFSVKPADPREFLVPIQRFPGNQNLTVLPAFPSLIF